MTTLWIDTEFNGYKGALIAMALIDVDGREWYEAIEIDALVDPWVADNVIPKLGKAPITRHAMQQSLSDFLRPYAAVHVVSDWPEDTKHFCDLLITGPGTRIDTPPLTMEVLRIDTVSMNPHNALADARAIRLACLS